MIPQNVQNAMDWIRGAEIGNDYLDRHEGGIVFVAPEQHLELLEKALELVRFLEFEKSERS